MKTLLYSTHHIQLILQLHTAILAYALIFFYTRSTANNLLPSFLFSYSFSCALIFLYTRSISNNCVVLITIPLLLLASFCFIFTIFAQLLSSFLPFYKSIIVFMDTHAAAAYEPTEVEKAVDQAYSRLRSDFSERFDSLLRDMEFLRADLTVQRGDLSSVQRDVGLVQSDGISLRSEFSIFSSSPPSHR